MPLLPLGKDILKSNAGRRGAHACLLLPLCCHASRDFTPGSTQAVRRLLWPCSWQWPRSPAAFSAQAVKLWDWTWTLSHSGSSFWRRIPLFLVSSQLILPVVNRHKEKVTKPRGRPCPPPTGNRQFFVCSQILFKDLWKLQSYRKGNTCYFSKC